MGKIDDFAKQATDVIRGHVNELFNSGADLSAERLNICKECPLYSESNFGPLCDSKKWINPKTNEFSLISKKGFVRGCGCRLTAKTTLKDNHCIINKW